MKGTKAAGRYALSLIDLAEERKQVEEIKKDMELVAATIAESRELDLLLHSPIIKTDKKKSVLKSVFEKAVQELTMSFMLTVTAKGREWLLTAIAEAFVSIYKERNGIVTAHVTTAVAMSDAQRKEVSQVLAPLGSKIELVETVDKHILGGMKVCVADQRVDASFRKKLNELKYDIHNL